MPSLGTAQGASAAGVMKRGILIPAGSLTATKAALATSTSQLVEIVCYGDSTTYGSADNSDGPPWYSWLSNKLRALLQAQYGNGGSGFMQPGDQSQLTNPNGDGYPTASLSGFAGAGGMQAGPFGFASVTAGDVATFTFKGTAVRVNFYTHGGGAHATAAVDGGTATAVDLVSKADIAAGFIEFGPSPIYIGGLTDGVHTLAVTNTGGGAIWDMTSSGKAAASAIAGVFSGTAGSYYYKVTAVSASGESLPTVALGPVAVDGSHKAQVQFTVQAGWTAVKMYRSATSGGTYGLVATQGTIPGGGAVGAVVDDGSVSPGVAPPSSSTLGNLATGRMEFNVDFLKGTGVTVHREAQSGAITSQYFDAVGALHGAINYAAATLGLVGINAGTVNGYVNGCARGSAPAYRKPVLSMIQIGTNDLGGYATPNTDGSTNTNYNTYIENLGLFCRTARAAGSDIMLIMPPYTAAVADYQQKYGARFKREMVGLALAYGAVLVDFQEALGYDVANWGSRHYGPGAATRPHLPQAAYDAEANFVFDGLLSPAALATIA